jgi:hypothetical protein
MNSLELGIEIRSNLERNLYENVIKLSQKRQTELIREGKLPNFTYTGVQIERLQSIQEITELKTFLEIIGNSRNDELQFCISAWESLGLGYAESFLALTCDIETTKMIELSLFKDSEKFENPIWNAVLFKDPNYPPKLISHNLSFDARIILSVNKLFTRKVTVNLNNIQERTFLSHSRLSDAINELLNCNYFIKTTTKDTYTSNLSLNKESKYHRAWSKLIGHYFVSKMSTLGRLKFYNLNAIDFHQGKSFFKAVLASKDCQTCQSKSKSVLKSLAQLPPFHLGCRCTFTLDVPKRGTI